MTDYNTRVIGDGDSRRLAIRTDEEETFGDRIQFTISVNDGKAALLAGRYLKEFVDSYGIEPVSEATWDPDVGPFSGRRKMRVERWEEDDMGPGLKVECGCSIRVYGLLRAEALLALNKIIGRFVHPSIDAMYQQRLDEVPKPAYRAE